MEGTWLEVSYRLIREDLRLYYQECHKAHSMFKKTFATSLRRWGWYVVIFGLPLILLLAWNLHCRSSTLREGVTGLFIVSWLLFWSVVYPRWEIWRLSRAPEVFEQHTVRLSEVGLLWQSSLWESTLYWPFVYDIVMTKSFVWFLYGHKNSLLAIPKRVFTDDNAQVFFSAAVAYWQQAHEGTA